MNSSATIKHMDDKALTKLAELARLDISSDDNEKLRTDMGGILEYISHIQKIATADTAEPENKTEAQLRDDTHVYESGMYSERLLAEAPKTKNGYIQVKKILGQ